ncbi:hypothetical protein PHSY_004160 [Pseudozyma hubeiensis SY62]|uniref:Uncharacterized protein n=1 Tax=Pseudozyma hubeiensis (strain SY62) TaxID=1305764 RepID=R9P5H7_PSEHS|nr:hypothetical protein PHSY_004160 [Pseudozyma hubeiensis SY62]GAC96579.1 hypothetical protein PHSY_004160 [Pseudozyma hubeiensis SY62]
MRLECHAFELDGDERGVGCSPSFSPALVFPLSQEIRSSVSFRSFFAMVKLKQCVLLLVTAGLAFASVVVATDAKEDSLSNDRTAPHEDGRAGKHDQVSHSESLPHNSHDSFDPSAPHGIPPRGSAHHTDDLDQQLSEFLSTHGYRLSSTTHPSLCLLPSPGCTAYTVEEKKEIAADVRTMFAANTCAGEEGCGLLGKEAIADLAMKMDEGGEKDGRKHEKRSEQGDAGVHADLFSQTQILSTARRISSTAVQLATSNQGYCELHAPTCKNDPCPLTTAGCIPFTREEKQQYEEELYVMLAKVLSTGRCTGSGGCEEGEECELWDDRGERTEGCRVPTDKEVEAGVRNAMDGRFGSSPNPTPAKVKRDIGTTHLTFDIFSQHPHIHSNQLAKPAQQIAHKLVPPAFHGVGYCKSGSTTCLSTDCQLPSPDCLPYSTGEVQQMEDMVRDVLISNWSTGNCDATAKKDNCDRDGSCNVWAGGKRDAECETLSGKEVKHRVFVGVAQILGEDAGDAEGEWRDEKVEKEEVVSVRQRLLGKIRCFPESGSVLLDVESKELGEDHKDLVKRILSFDEPNPDDHPHLDDSTLHRSSPRIVVPTSSLSSPDLPAPSRHELQSFMSLCSQLSSNSAELAQIATAAGITDPRDIESLRLRFATLAEDREQATEVLKQAKMAQMLGESKVERGGEEGGDVESDEGKKE